MKINCLSCGHNFDLSDAYDTYEGQVRCFVCRAVLEIKTEDGLVRTVRFAGHSPVRDTFSPFSSDDPSTESRAVDGGGEEEFP